MGREIPFNEIMKNHKNWHKDCDYDIMSENHAILKPLIPLCFFDGMPEHPKLFPLLFSQKGFAKLIIDGAIKLNIRNCKKIMFVEFSPEDRNKLIEKGMFQLIPCALGATCIRFDKSDDGEILYVNVIL